jgi:chromosome partitioning protein
MKIITVTGYKGGVAKSCTAVHLATFLSEKGDVLLVDGDPNRTAIAWSKRGNLPFTVADERQAMRMVTGRDFLVIDTPARPHTDDLKELAKGCDLLILPTVPDVVSLEPMLETARDLGDAHYKALLTIVPPAPSKEGQMMRDDLLANSVPVFRTMIRRSAGFQKAALAGVSLRDLPEARSRLAWRDYVELGREVLEELSNG